MRYSKFAKSAALLGALAFFGCSESTDPVAQLTPQFIVNGTPTGSSFGSVGALFYDFDSDGVTSNDLVCTGSLISSTVFLTAAHCLNFLPAGSQVYVSFDNDVNPRPKPLIKASAFYYDAPNGPYKSDGKDLGVVIIPASSTSGMTVYKLPRAGYLDDLSAQGKLSKTLFINVGYGTSANRTGVPDLTYDGIRKWSKSEYMGLQQYWLGLLMNSNATGEGGDCYGDSGGPKFIDGDLTTIVATVTTGDMWCRATSWDYRLDTSSARNFLGRFVALP
jgi:hypothetical protein